jgi:hypothetical protein
MRKETRGRKPKYDFSPLKKGKKVTMPFSNSARVSARAYAINNKISIETWREGNMLIVNIRINTTYPNGKSKL